MVRSQPRPALVALGQRFPTAGDVVENTSLCSGSIESSSVNSVPEYILVFIVLCCCEYIPVLRSLFLIIHPGIIACGGCECIPVFVVVVRCFIRIEMLSCAFPCTSHQSV